MSYSSGNPRTKGSSRKRNYTSNGSHRLLSCSSKNSSKPSTPGGFNTKLNLATTVKRKRFYSGECTDGRLNLDNFDTVKRRSQRTSSRKRLLNSNTIGTPRSSKHAFYKSDSNSRKPKPNVPPLNIKFSSDHKKRYPSKPPLPSNRILGGVSTPSGNKPLIKGKCLNYKQRVREVADPIMVAHQALNSSILKRMASSFKSRSKRSIEVQSPLRRKNLETKPIQGQKLGEISPLKQHEQSKFFDQSLDYLKREFLDNNVL